MQIKIQAYAKGKKQYMQYLNLDHLYQLTDDTGLLQHATYAFPNYHEGYTTDDNARALAFSVMLEKMGPEWTRDACKLASRYISFLFYAFNKDEMRFRNFLSFDRRWLEKIGSEDSQGRAVWALCLTVARSQQYQLRRAAEDLLELALPGVATFSYPRPWAYALIGFRHYLRHTTHDLMQDIGKAIADKLFDAYQHNREHAWLWSEDRLTYCNAVLPHGMLAAGQVWNRDDWISSGLECLRWLIDVQRSDENLFSPIGADVFFLKGQVRARFIQQPIEAYTTVSACLEGYQLTNDPFWIEEAKRANRWFLGANDTRISLYDPQTGGCQDGLREAGVNPNQGAESTLAFLLALIEMQSVLRE